MRYLTRNHKQMTVVSVVIPTLDRPERLQRALDSVQSQTYRPLEVIVVDGNKNEDTLDVTENVDINVNHIDQEEGELPGARNIGIEESEGEYIAFLDDDDWWAPEKIERQVEKIQEEEAGFVYTGIVRVDTEGNTISVSRRDGVPDKRAILTKNWIGTPSSIMVTRESFDKIGLFDEDIPYREDWELYIRLVYGVEGAVIPDPLTKKESHPNSMALNVDLVKRDYQKMFEKHREKYDEETETEFWSNYHFDMGRHNAKVGKMSTSRRHYLESMTYEFKFRRIGHVFAASLGNFGYDKLTHVYRFGRDLKMKLSA